MPFQTQGSSFCGDLDIIKTFFRKGTEGDEKCFRKIKINKYWQ